MSQNRQKLILNWIVKRLIFSKLRKRIWGSECRGFEPHIPPTDILRDVFFFCIVACTLRHSLSVSPSVSVSKLPIRLYYPLKSWQMSHYTKNRWMWGLLNLGSCSFHSLRSALLAPYDCSFLSLRSAHLVRRASPKFHQKHCKSTICSAF